MIDQEKVELILSEEIIEEYIDVANRDEIMEKVERKGLTTSKIVDKAINSATIVEPQEKVNVVTDDPDDNKIIEAAVAGNAQYIVTQDNHLLTLKKHNDIKIVTPEDMLNILRKEESTSTESQDI